MLSGTLPTEIGLMASLRTLWTYSNQLVGPIPTEFSGLFSLESFVSFDNGHTGTLPDIWLFLAFMRE